MQELWKEISCYGGYCEISSFGRVRSMTRRVIHPNIPQGVILQSQRIKTFIIESGYELVNLSKDGYRKPYSIHTLVAKAFIANPLNKPEVNHKDTNKLNNRVDNLEWATLQENRLHAYVYSRKSPTVKYVVWCPELDIMTFGLQEMVRQLQKLGYRNITSSTVLKTMNNGSKYYDLRFKKICDWRNQTLQFTNGDMKQAIELNQKLYAYPDAVKDALLQRFA